MVQEVRGSVLDNKPYKITQFLLVLYSKVQFLGSLGRQTYRFIWLEVQNSMVREVRGSEFLGFIQV